MAFSVIIPTWRRSEMLRQSLENLLACYPAPAEILVHIDADDDHTEAMLEREFHGRAVWFKSTTTQGPGGGRNRLVRQANQPLIASFDDDSWPLDKDFFAVAQQLMAEHPRAGLVTGAVMLKNETPAPVQEMLREVACFENCGCVFRKEAFSATSGYVPLRYAYGMEEADLALQLLDTDWKIYRSAALRVHHDTELSHHPSPAINAAHITNTALLAFLRYPLRYWPLGLLQVLNRMRYAARVGRWAGIGRGLAQIPVVCWQHRRHRRPVSPATLKCSRQLSRGRQREAKS